MENLKLYPSLKTVRSFNQYEAEVDALFVFDRAINKSNMFGDNAEWYKEKIGLENGHNGIDISCSIGSEVVASHPGWIREATMDPSGGLGIVLVSFEPYIWKDKTEEYVKTIYWHNSKNLAKVGDEYDVGQTIALAGNTCFSTGPHLNHGGKQCDKKGNTLNWGNGYLGAIDIYPYYQYWNLKQILNTMIIDTDEKIKLVYQSVLKRDPDTEGAKYWKGKSIWDFLKAASTGQESKQLKTIISWGKYFLGSFGK